VLPLVLLDSSMNPSDVVDERVVEQVRIPDLKVWLLTTASIQIVRLTRNLKADSGV
jgi:hypothetical protein